MDRRGFLKLVGLGLPSVALAEKLGLVERIKSYFFAPAGGWKQDLVAFMNADQEAAWENVGIALQLEKVRNQIPVIYQNDLVLARAFEAGEEVTVYSGNLRKIRGVFRLSDVDRENNVLTLESLPG